MESPLVIGLLSRRVARPRGLDDVFAAPRPALRWAGIFAEVGDVPEGLDVVLVDLDEMPRRWEGAVSRLLAAAPRRKVAFLGASFSPALRRKASELGVSAFVLGTLAPDALAQSLRDAGRERKRRGVTEALSGTLKGWPGRDLGLTQRESEVLCLSALGLTNNEIADRLYINVQTVKSHLKRVYKRIGVRNRAEAASYAYSTGLIAATAVADEVAGNEPVLPEELVSDEPAGVLREHFGLDPRAIAARAARFGLGAASLGVLHGAAGEMAASDSAAGLIATWRAYADTAPLAADAATRERIVEHLSRYTAELFSGELTEDHVEAMVRAGATLRVLGVSPSWILLSLGRLVCDHVEPLFTCSATAAEAIDRVTTLLAAVMFDLSVIVEPYLEPAASASAPPAITTVSVTEADVVARRKFLGLAPGRPQVLPRADGAVHPVHEVARNVDELIGFAQLRPADADALIADGVSLLDEFGSSELDRSRAASYRRLGLLCRRVGLSAETVLLCSSMLVRSALGGVGATVPVEPGNVAAFLRALWFDASFMFDEVLGVSDEPAPMAATFSDALGAGLTTGVALLSVNGTVLVADSLLGRQRVPDEFSPSRHLVHTVLRTPLVEKLAAQALADSHATVTGTVVQRDRTLRVAASAVAGVAPLGGPYVAVVIQDVTELAAAHDALVDENRRLSAALRAVGAAVWELDPSDFTILALSRQAEEIVGARDLDLVGRRTWIDFLHGDDRRWFLHAIRKLGIGERAERDHLMGPPGEEPIWLRTSMIGTIDETGRRTVSGVSTRIDAPEQSAR